MVSYVPFKGGESVPAYWVVVESDVISRPRRELNREKRIRT